MTIRFNYTAYDEESQALQSELKTLYSSVADKLEQMALKMPLIPNALKSLEESYMWTGKAIRDDQIIRNGAATLKEERGNS